MVKPLVEYGCAIVPGTRRRIFYLGYTEVVTSVQSRTVNRVNGNRGSNSVAMKFRKSSKIEDQPEAEKDSALLTMAADDAIVIRNARKSYGKGVQILDDLNMIVKRGSM
ncbi:uncharacterized protein LOC107274606 isoform X2 [Cephus cinctus]|uniref:Uncharacterized protein LOC107274606 isoform X2 n=1 Tax=Cephus cinctus TaxID=211228 RepID=A0AAJ7RV31_CEPCN|nr:uncharacterized protein LOC107274606 isoform X2 [Cephus cinctus]